MFSIKGTSVTITGTSVIFNQARALGGDGGVYYIQNSATGVTLITMTSSQFLTNSASVNGGILSTIGQDATFRCITCTITSVSSTTGSGGLLYLASTATSTVTFESTSVISTVSAS